MKLIIILEINTIIWLINQRWGFTIIMPKREISDWEKSRSHNLLILFLTTSPSHLLQMLPIPSHTLR